MVDNIQLRGQIVELYLNLKKLIIVSEELLRGYKTSGEPREERRHTFLQPILEQRNTLDHLMRAEAVVLGKSSRSNADEYVRKQLIKALHHLYRGYFDAADWLSIRTREEVLHLLGGHSHQAINAAIPNYYSELRPQLEQYSGKIAALRSDKDAEKEPDEMFADVEHYAQVLERIKEIYETIALRMPSLLEHSASEERRRGDEARTQRANRWWGVAAGIAGAVLGAVLTYLLTRP